MIKRQLLFIIILFLAFSCKPKEANKSENTQRKEKQSTAISVEAKTISTALLEKEIHATSQTAGIRESLIVSEANGRIEKVLFKMGNYVRKGQLLVTVNATVQKAAKEQAEAALETAKLNVKIAEKLKQSGNSSEMEYVRAHSQLKSAQAALSQATKRYNDCFIYAPFSGYIVKKEATIEKGSFLTTGSVIARIITISKMKAEFQIGEREISLVTKGMTATLHIPALDNEKIMGKVSAVSLASDPQSGSFPIEITWANKKTKIKAGMLVHLTIKSKKASHVPVVPLSAIFMKDDKKAVFVEENGKAALRFIKTGRYKGNLVEITSGVETGRNLIVSGTTVLKGGDTVKTTLVGTTGGAQ